MASAVPVNTMLLVASTPPLSGENETITGARGGEGGGGGGGGEGGEGGGEKTWMGEAVAALLGPVKLDAARTVLSKL